MKGIAVNESIGHKPSDFLLAVPPKRHCALFFEDDATGRKLEFEFVERGLAEKQRCLYIVHSDEETAAIEGKMKENASLREGIRKGLLATYRDTHLPQSSDEVPAWFAERMKSMSQGSKEQLRVVGTTLPEIATVDQMTTQGAIEAAIQSAVGDSAMTVLCSFCAAKVSDDVRNDWFLRMIQNHHSAIFAPKKGEGVAFDMR